MAPRVDRRQVGEARRLREVYGQHLAYRASDQLDQRLHDGGARHGAGVDLRDEFGLAAAGIQHLPRLVRAHRHARLGQHVLALLQRLECNRVVHIGPRAYDDGVYIRIVEKLRPLVVDPWDTLLARNALARMAGAVDDAQDLDALDGLETRYVGVPRVGAGPDETHSYPMSGQIRTSGSRHSS